MTLYIDETKLKKPLAEWTDKELADAEDCALADNALAWKYSHNARFRAPIRKWLDLLTTERARRKVGSHPDSTQP